MLICFLSEPKLTNGTQNTMTTVPEQRVAVWRLAFTRSFNDLVVASFVPGPGSSTLPLIIFSKVRLGVSPDINALAIRLISTVEVCIIAGTVVLKRRTPDPTALVQSDQTT